MNVFIVIGDANTRKSSVVRCLTGCFNKNDRDIELISRTKITVFARVSSLQEAEITSLDFIKEMTKKNPTDILLCLWESPNKKDAVKYPDALTYIKDFIAAGWTISKTVALGNIKNIGMYSNNMSFPNSKIDPVNLTTQGIRKHFGWL